MEPAAAWAPCQFQLANWTVEEQAHDAVWAPAAAGLPLEYSSIDISDGIWNLQSYVPSSYSGGQNQLVEYSYYAAATQHDAPIIENATAAAAQESLEVGLLHDMKMQIYSNNPILVFHEAARIFYDDTKLIKTKIHRYPPSIQNLGSWYTVPRIVAIGPYHHGKEQLKHAEDVKHVAAYYCIKDSGYSVQDMYNAVVHVVEEIDARRLYNKDKMEGIIKNDNIFLPMMFYDACFLVMYMLKLSGKECNKMLYDFFESNANDIDHDIMLLENQIPWPVVDAIIKYTSVSLKEFIAKWNDGRLVDRVDQDPNADFDDSYEPPHLLGLLRFHIVGKSRRTKVHGTEKMKSIGISVSAIELAKMGINLTANKTTELADMDLTKKPIFFAKLSMAPLSLNDLRASLLVNMAALEQCTTPDFFDKDEGYEASAVCSYLRLLCMLVHRKEDVHELRTKGILQGGAGLNNKKVLDLLTSLQSLRLGRCCARIVVQVENYRINMAGRIKVYAFFSNNWKTIAGVFSAIGVFVSILGAINSLKGAHRYIYF